MTIKRIFVPAMLLFLLFSCAAAAKDGEMRIALWKLPLNLPAIVAVEEGRYEEAFRGEKKIVYVSLPSGPRQVQAMAAGELDIAEGLGAAAVILAIANGVDITIVGANGRSPSSFAVVVKDSTVTKISDLKGKKVAGLRGSVVHQLFVELLHESGLKEKDVEFFPMTLSASASALLAGRVEAALLVGTEIIRAREGGCRVLADGRGRLNGLSLIAARREFAAKNPEAIEKYLTIREKIREETEVSYKSYMALIKKETGLSEKEIIKMLSDFDYSTKITKLDLKELNKTSCYLKKENIIKTVPGLGNILWK